MAIGKKNIRMLDVLQELHTLAAGESGNPILSLGKQLLKGIYVYRVKFHFYDSNHA